MSNLMTALHIFLAVFLMSGYVGADTPPHHKDTHDHVRHSAHHSHNDLKAIHSSHASHHGHDKKAEGSYISNFDNMDVTNYTIVPLDDVVMGFDVNSAVHLTNVELLVPNHFHLGNIDPDFSKMVLDINSVIGSFEIRSDYRIFTNNIMSFPISSQGKVYIQYKNVTAIGRTPLALTPAAFLALNFDFIYNPEVVTVKIVPEFLDIVTNEVRLSKELVGGPLFHIMNQKLQNNLDYYMETHINFFLGKISVFTVGHTNENSFENEPPQQNVKLSDLFDELLEDVKEEIITNNKDKLNIPNFYRNFSEKLEMKVVNGTFSAKDGWVSGLSTLRRASNVSLSKRENIFFLSAGIQFEKLNMGYDKYEAMFLKENVTGSLNGSFLHKLMTIKVAMDPHEDGTCISTLAELRMFKINGYRIGNITNIASMDWLQRRINNWLVGYYHTSINGTVVKELKTAIKDSFSHFDCGEYLPHLKILI